MRKPKKRVRPVFPTPFPIHRYDMAGYAAFVDREERRAVDGRLTYREYAAMSFEDQRRNKDPEKEFWRIRKSNQSRGGAQRLARHRRTSAIRLTKGPGTDAFYREVRNAKTIVCEYCGRLVPKGRREIDHDVPLSRSGQHTRENLRAACRRCNRSKCTMTGVEFRYALAKAAEARQLALTT